MKACFIITTVSFNYEKSNWLCSCRLAFRKCIVLFFPTCTTFGSFLHEHFSEGLDAQVAAQQCCRVMHCVHCCRGNKISQTLPWCFFFCYHPFTIVTSVIETVTSIEPQHRMTTTTKKRKCVCTKAQEMKGRKKWGSQSGKSQWGHCFSQLRPKKTNIIGTLQGKSGRREV